jgi:hypothetical protein
MKFMTGRLMTGRRRAGTARTKPARRIKPPPRNRRIRIVVAMGSLYAASATALRIPGGNGRLAVDLPHRS